MEFLKAAPEQIAKFATFVVLFVKSPRTALRPYEPADPTARPEVSGQLILFCALGVACGALMMAIGHALGMAEDRSSSVAIVNRLDPRVLPVAAVVAILITSGVWHGLTRVIAAALGGAVPDLRFGGAIENSLNAGLAVGTVYVPAASIVLVAMRIAAAHISLSWVVFLVASVLLAFGFLAYFVLAFAAAHRVPAWRYFVVFAFTVTGLHYLASLAG